MSEKGWLAGRFGQDGVDAPFFPPQQEQAAAAEVQAIIGQSPHAFGLGRSRWWLAGVRQLLPWLTERSLSCVWHTLRRLGLRYKRGRTYVHSPDPEYRSKLARIALRHHWVQQQAIMHPTRYVLLYEDEFTYYRQPTVSSSYAPAGSDLPHATVTPGHNTTRRIAATLDVRSGRLVAWQRDRFDRHTLSRYFLAVAQAYPDAKRIWIALDNWPVHFHPEVLRTLATTPIRFLPLPTYAPWTNPVEKVWRKLNQEILHLHPFSDDWEQLKATIQAFLDRFAHGSDALLHEVGLLAY